MKPTIRAFTQHPRWDLAFRPWFLLASISTVISMSFWLLYLNGHNNYLAQLSLAPVLWHAHEMIFGFAATIAVAFLLTAAQTWTGKRSLHGSPLILISLVWLSARILLWHNGTYSLPLAIAAQGLWWLLSISALARLLISSGNRRNYIFTPLLTIMMLINLTVLYAGMKQNITLGLHLLHTMVLLFGLLIGIIGGRVIPFFTQKGAPQATVQATPTLDKWIIIVSILGVFVFMGSYFFTAPLSPALLMIVAGLSHLLRLKYWHTSATTGIALLWSLHLAYGLLGIGLITLGLSDFLAFIAFSDALHIITIGAIGAMILSMMARVSLGHTGRPLSTHPLIYSAFALLFIGVLARFLFPLFSMPIIGWNMSGALWGLSFCLFIIYYAPILMQKK